MTDKYLHPDKNLAVKYVIAAFLLYILDYLLPMSGLISIILLFIGIRAFQNDENNHFKTAYKSLKKMTVAYAVLRLSVFVPETGMFAISTSTVVGLIAMGISTIYFIYMTTILPRVFFLMPRRQRSILQSSVLTHLGYSSEPCQ